MRTHIVGTENRYFESEEQADAGCTPTVIRQLVARANPDRQTWTVSRIVAMPIPGIEAVPMKLRIALAAATILSMPAESASVITRTASLREAYNLVRGDEENPELVAVLPVIRQHNRPEDHHEYWRNMPQPL